MLAELSQIGLLFLSVFTGRDNVQACGARLALVSPADRNNGRMASKRSESARLKCSYNFGSRWRTSATVMITRWTVMSDSSDARASQSSFNLLEQLFRKSCLTN